MNYRFEIDGLRAIAVLPVMLFHAGIEAFGGGYIGVDVFFVISGYLITSLIVVEMEAGSFSLVSFYERRARRLLPALFFVIAVCIPFAWSWMTPLELVTFGKGVVAVGLFSSNILFWLESGYFSTSMELNPLLHTWSLAVEEQYYLLFPAIFLLLRRISKSLLVTLIIVAAFASLALAHWSSSYYSTANFYLLPTRLWELLVGSLCGIFLLRNSFFSSLGNTNCGIPTVPLQLSAQILAGLGLFLIILSVFLFDANTPFPSLYTLLPTLGTALIIVFGTKDTIVGRLLAHQVLVTIGLISYSAYLWHQPLLAFARIRTPGHAPSWMFPLLILLSLVLAYFTWKYIESPFRAKGKLSRPLIFCSSVVGLVALTTVGLLLYLNNGFANRITPGGAQFSSISTVHQTQANHGLNEQCEGVVDVTDCRTDKQPNVAIWGDSYAKHLVKGVLASNPDARIIQMTKNICGPIVGVSPITRNHGIVSAEQCTQYNENVMQWLRDNSSVEYVVLASSFYQYLLKSVKLLTVSGIESTGIEIAYKHFSKTLDSLLEMNIHPVVFAPLPETGFDLGRCLSVQEIFNYGPKTCDFNISKISKDQIPIFELLKRIDKRYRVIWPGEFVCKNEVCRSRIEGVPVYRDTGHMSREGSRYIGKQMNFYELITKEQNK